MTTRAIAVALVIVAALSPAPAKEVSSELLVEPLVNSYPAAREPGDQCDRGHTGYYWTVDSWFTGAESYAVYCDPAGCSDCAGSWRPLSVTIYLYWENENSCGLSVHAEILDADLSDPDGPSPGSSVLATSASMTAGPFSPPGLWAVTVPFPEECDGLAGPFFASVVFEDSCDEPPALVNDPGPCEGRASWNDWGIGWDELCAYTFPGNLSMYVTMECIGSSPVKRASWTTIKDIYR